MNKEFFQQLFRAQHGYVYRYSGTMPEGESAAHYITDAFAVAVGTNLLNTKVIELPTFNTTVVYADSAENLKTSVDFELITDLIPDVIPVVEPVVEEITPPTEG